MDAATAGVISTGALGLAGIAATFFAPTWTERTLERRREARAFRRAQRLVANELTGLLATFSTAIKRDTPPPAALETLTTGAWEAERSVLAESPPDDLWVELGTLYAIISRTIIVIRAASEGGLVVSSGRAGENILQTTKEITEMRERLLAARIVG